MPLLFRIFMPRRAAAISLAGLLAGGMLLPVEAVDMPDQATPMALTGIMRDLGQDMQAVTDAIAREDWPKVTALAPRIGDHPQPPLAEKLRILAFVGKDKGRFRSYDKQTHEAAQQLAKAAQREDGSATISAFADVQTACLACHQQFRKPFQEHFHGRR